MKHGIVWTVKDKLFAKEVFLMDKSLNTCKWYVMV